MPPILHVADLSDAVFDDIRDASRTYAQKYSYTTAFDRLMTLPERRLYLDSILAGQKDGEKAIQRIRDWLLGPWNSARSLSESRLPHIGRGLLAAAAELRTIEPSTGLAETSPEIVEVMIRAFAVLDDCPGVGGTIASKILSALRPSLFMIWDIPIARAYGFDPSVTGYRRFLQLMVPVMSRMKELWGDRKPSLEEHLRCRGREWLPPLAKFVDEWHWVRLTQKQPYASA